MTDWDNSPVGSGTYTDEDLIMQLLKDNITLWTADLQAEEQK